MEYTVPMIEFIKAFFLQSSQLLLSRIDKLTIFQPWYASNLEIGLIWLDGDNTNALPQALSFQLDAFAESPDKKAQYIEWKDTLCKSTPRFSTWQDLDWNSLIPIFKPPLKYEADSVTGGQGGDKDFGRVVDNDDCPCDKEKERILRLDDKCKDRGIQASQPPSDAATKKREEMPQREGGSKDIRRRFEGQLVVSSQRSHNATELCDSETSFGPDFVSTEEGVFCSMSQKKTFPICCHDRDSSEDTHICFDLEVNALVMPESEDTAHTKRIRDELPATNYSLVRRW
ncbi:hypothetical protein LA080_012779 [Diaporthe eres]|nr:hypothetical protein LA080_012779 [Diaporthe eres]